jgi:galactose mutarotase-like enzyme
MENESVRVAVLPDKGAEIIEFRYKSADLDVLWHAPQPLTALGSYAPSVARAGGSFLDYYAGGWQEIFPSAGPATVYKGAELGQHGEVALLAWRMRTVQDSATRIELEFTVETMRTPFRLERRMILESKSPRLRLEERVINLGVDEMAYAWGHHPTFGAPFLSAGCLIETAAARVEVPEALAQLPARRLAVGESDFPSAPGADGLEQRVDVVNAMECRTEDVVVLKNFSDGWCALRNPQLSLAVTMAWDARIFPYLWSWQLYGGNREYPYYGRAYTLGLEPFSCPFEPLVALVGRGAAPMLQAGGEACGELEIGFVETSRPVKHAACGGDIRLAG